MYLQKNQRVWRREDPDIGAIVGLLIVEARYGPLYGVGRAESGARLDIRDGLHPRAEMQGEGRLELRKGYTRREEGFLLCTSPGGDCYSAAADTCSAADLELLIPQ